MEFKEASKFQEALEKVRTDGDPKIILDALEELGRDYEIAARDASRAENAYYASAKAKEQKISDRIEALKKQLAECDAKIDALREPLILATTSGDGQRLHDIQDRMKELQAEQAQLATEIDMLSEAHIPGDKDLYEVVEEKNALYVSRREIYFAAKKEAYELALDKTTAFEELEQETKYYNLDSVNYRPSISKVREHFHSKAKKAEG